ncbi:acetolactate synthase small subunit [Thermodesulfomicrobium sp. WS]|uniref:acetolactate synthase small subunit n=1 Tax=Thermodesulfomicrobium sp. WS TaxID=3004129 RepID=UPI0024910D0B|nr:acetolactate synthase small subunit [Thermodesulfomicrobium sp. WS]BDV02039.1 acetolactate synthase small subunit [Thermodesulfomicrobium sp. WS]
MRHTISALVHNQPGVLASMAAVFQQHGLNIFSISAGETERADVSRIVICVDHDSGRVAAATAQLAGLPFVLGLEDLASHELIDRELLLIKVRVAKDTVSQLLQIIEVFRANVVDMGNTTLVAELAATPGKVAGFLRALIPHGIVSVSRTGVIAIKRGDE